MANNIVISEEKLKRIINESVEKMLSSYGLIDEMAINLGKYVRKVESFMPQIAAHWCLVYYFKTNNIATSLLPHWKGEVKKFMKILSQENLNENAKTKAIYRALSNIGFDKNNNAVYNAIKKKLIKEKINIKDKNTFQVIFSACDAFVLSTKEIANLIGYGSEKDIIVYTSEIGSKKIIKE